MLIFGSVPALRGTRIDVNASLQSAAPRGRGRRHAVARGLVGPSFAVQRLELTYAAPTYHDDYAAFFGCELRFGADTAAPAARLILSQWFDTGDHVFHAGASETN